jgi:hypothetical protein
VAAPRQHGNEPSGSIRGGDFLIRCVTISFSRKVLLQGVSCISNEDTIQKHFRSLIVLSYFNLHYEMIHTVTEDRT